jgi:hypothetical protein
MVKRGDSRRYSGSFPSAEAATGAAIFAVLDDEILPGYSMSWDQERRRMVPTPCEREVACEQWAAYDGL